MVSVVKWWVPAFLLLASVVEAQDFEPPALEGAGSSRPFYLGLLGFGVRTGLVLDDGVNEAAIGATLDLGNLGSSRFRLRPSGEVTVGTSVNTYLVSVEALFRLLDDLQIAVPYLGGGVGVYGQQDCDADPARACPDLWGSISFGVEIRLRPTINWLLEYHSLAGFNRHRLYIGLATRRAG